MNITQQFFITCLHVCSNLPDPLTSNNVQADALASSSPLTLSFKTTQISHELIPQN